jgi:thiamine-phosphate diphosphorylase
MKLPPALIAVSPGTCTAREAPALLARLLELARCDHVGILLREPGLSTRVQRELLSALRAGARTAWIAAHERPALALAAGCDAVHLSFRCLLPRELRAWLGARLCVGLSAHAADDAERWRDADYLFLGPVHPTPSKRGWVEPLHAAGLARELRRTGDTPVWAIGGLTAADAADVHAAGARGFALRAALFEAARPVAAAETCVEAWIACGGFVVADGGTR